MINSIIDLLIRTTEKNSDGIGLKSENTSFTWKEILNTTQRIASGLLCNNYIISNNNNPIPVVMNKSAIEIIVFWGIAYTGNFYVPIDEKMPDERMGLIFDVLEPEILICDDDNKGKLIKKFNKEIKIISISELISNDIDFPLIENCRKRIIDTDPIYALFTSGSTGNPKGVICCHRSVIKYSEWVVETFNFSSKTICGNQTPLYFSMSVLDLYSVLRSGACLDIIPSQLFSQPKKLIEYLNLRMINTIYWVPSALCMISRFKALDKFNPTTLEKVLFAGEVMPTKQLNYWRDHKPELLYANLFGPTEITDIGTYYIVEREFADNEPIPIGQRCSNVDFLILDEQMNQVKKGNIGELYFRGTFLALGYYGDFEKTEQTYIQNPLNNKYPEIVYRSGDLVVINEKDELIYVSRKDGQIKHSGYRIELGEIETAINSIENIDRSCCFLDEEKDKIVAVYTLENNQGIDERTNIIQGLKEKLPKYMIPNIYVLRENMPLNPNGKIDRRLLKEDYNNTRESI